MKNFQEYIDERLDESSASYKRKYETAPDDVKAVADHLKHLKSLSTSELRPLADRARRVHSARSKDELMSVVMASKFSNKQLQKHDDHFYGNK